MSEWQKKAVCMACHEKVYVCIARKSETVFEMVKAARLHCPKM